MNRPAHPVKPLADIAGLMALAVAPFGVVWPGKLLAHVRAAGGLESGPDAVSAILNELGYAFKTTCALPDGGVVLVWPEGPAGPLWLRLNSLRWFGPDGKPEKTAPACGGQAVYLAVTAAPAHGQDDVLAWFWAPLRQGGVWHGALWKVAGWSVLISLMGGALPVFNLMVYDRVLPVGALQTLWLLTLGILLMLGLDFALRLLKSFTLGQELARVGQAQDAVLLRTLFSQRAGGSRWPDQLEVLKLAQTVREQLIMHVVPNLAELPVVLVFLAVIGWLAPVLLAVPVGLLVATVALQFWLLPYFHNNAVEAQKATQRRDALHVRVLRALPFSVLHNRQNDSHSQWQAQAQSLHAAAAAGELWQGISQHISIVVAQLSFVLVLLTGSYSVIGGQLSVGVLLAVSMLCSRTVTPALHLVDTLSRWQKAKVGLTELRRQLSWPVETLLPTAERPDMLAQAYGQLSLEDVRAEAFGQPGRALVQGINLKIGAAERWAIVGSSGAGKTSLLHVLAGLIQPVQGSLKLDDYLYARLPESEVRRHIALVAQHTVLPDLSVRQVLCGLGPVDEEALREALHVSGLDGVLKGMGVGLEYRAGPDGERFSGGQRQMLALATAIYRRPKVLLLDEPTSAMDPDAEAHICRTLAAWVAHYKVTLVLVTHRVPLLELVGHMAILASGRLLHAGSKASGIAFLKRKPAHD